MSLLSLLPEWVFETRYNPVNGLSPLNSLWHWHVTRASLLLQVPFYCRRLSVTLQTCITDGECSLSRSEYRLYLAASLPCKRHLNIRAQNTSSCLASLGYAVNTRCNSTKLAWSYFISRPNCQSNHASSFESIVPSPARPHASLLYPQQPRAGARWSSA